jgi:hypothetical protein
LEEREVVADLMRLSLSVRFTGIAMAVMTFSASLQKHTQEKYNSNSIAFILSQKCLYLDATPKASEMTVGWMPLVSRACAALRRALEEYI